LVASNTTVTGTIIGKDDNRPWINAVVTATFFPAYGFTGNYDWGGVSYNALPPVTAVADSNGFFTMLVPDNLTISPANTRWTFTFQPAATAQGFTSVPITVTGPTMDITTLVQNTIEAIQIDPLLMASAYVDAEVNALPGFGHLYFNMTNQILRYWNNINGGQWGSLMGSVPIYINAQLVTDSVPPTFTLIDLNTIVETGYYSIHGVINGPVGLIPWDSPGDPHNGQFNVGLEVIQGGGVDQASGIFSAQRCWDITAWGSPPNTWIRVVRAWDPNNPTDPSHWSDWWLLTMTEAGTNTPSEETQW
jgi:hypothetical protein